MRRNALTVFAAFIMSGCVVSTTAIAADLDCKDASSFYYYSMFNGKVMQAMAGACGNDLSQPACIAFLKVFVEHKSLLDKVEPDGIGRHLDELKEQCPSALPDDYKQL